MKAAKIQPCGVHVDQNELKRLQDRMKHDKVFEDRIHMVGLPLEYVAAMTSQTDENRRLVLWTRGFDKKI